MQNTVNLKASVQKTFRSSKVAGMFDIEWTGETTTQITHDQLPDTDENWQIGLVVGPSGSGKSTVAANKYGEPQKNKWTNGALVDDFREDLSITDICNALSHVGLSSPPAWLRPYSTLSMGQQFRANMARLIIENDIVFVDEFTSVVDRNVAKISSSAVSKAIRKTNKRLVCCACHYDIVEWLEPDWVLDMASGTLARGRLHRPKIKLQFGLCDKSAWRVFKGNHYLSSELSRAAKCYGLWAKDEMVAFCGVLHFPHPKSKIIKKESRLVCLPDYQGFGFGNRLSELVGEDLRKQGFRFLSVTSHPAMIAHRARSRLWKMKRAPSRVMALGKSSKLKAFSNTISTNRLTASFEYLGMR